MFSSKISDLNPEFRFRVNLLIISLNFSLPGCGSQFLFDLINSFGDDRSAVVAQSCGNDLVIFYNRMYN